MQPEPKSEPRDMARPVRDFEIVRPRRDQPEDILGGSLWMVGISLVLFFLPVINGFIGGLVGGYKVGDIRRALLAALLPAVVVGVGLWFIMAVLGLPVVGFIAGVAAGGWVVLSEFGLFAGAMIGGALGGMKRNDT